eukprot:3126344-Pleurochrysis_carterae.AAC.1
MPSCSGVAAKDAARLLAPIGFELVQDAQLQQHHRVWRTWYKAQTAGHVEQSINLGVVRAVPVIALVHIGDVGDVLEGGWRAEVGVHWQ